MHFNPGKNNVLQWRDENKYFKLRSKMSVGYSGCYIAADRPLEIDRKAQFVTLEVISDLAFKQPFGFMETDSDVYEYTKTTEESLPMFMETTVFPSSDTSVRVTAVPVAAAVGQGPARIRKMLGRDAFHWPSREMELGSNLVERWSSTKVPKRSLSV
ncbi:hypothetical protein CTA2_8271 [Colletotrichum tanaceti]|uniref:Uncharacterized protein n=1 Tax=Colletotrichum tanaceti TaxID=1306861 RepID=A0A4U6XDA7_9PEZI|nr:hypothetical protein CTA2_8271 [Colletotrichum tanaceti]TKW53605.1 hypothetical protein CTA1_2719 [Colletotrichum tanaceti]